MVFKQCREILLKERELVQHIAELQNVISEAVMNRKWADFEGHFNALSRIKAEIAVLEEQREGLFAGISTGMGEFTRFYTFAAKLPPEQRGELTAIYRNLKIETLRVQMIGESLMTYIIQVRTTLAGFFEIAFPDRGGKMYTPHGAPMSHDMRSMVVNRSF